MKSITDLRNALQTHIVGLEHQRWNPRVVLDIWNKISPIRKMPKRRSQTQKRQRGGAGYSLQGADLNYVMTPGSAFTTNPSVAVYDRFPIDPTVNPQVVSDLDVFFQSALSRGCGIENSTLKVPADMGSNQVGGSRRHRKRGGALTPGLLDGVKDSGHSLEYHPYVASAYPNIAHSLTHQWQGKVDSIPASSDPTDHTWTAATERVYPFSAIQTATVVGPSEWLMKTWPTTPSNSTTTPSPTPTPITPSPTPTPITPSPTTSGGQGGGGRSRSRYAKRTKRVKRTKRSKRTLRRR